MYRKRNDVTANEVGRAQYFNMVRLYLEMLLTVQPHSYANTRTEYVLESSCQRRTLPDISNGTISTPESRLRCLQLHNRHIIIL